MEGQRKDVFGMMMKMMMIIIISAIVHLYPHTVALVALHPVHLRLSHSSHPYVFSEKSFCPLVLCLLPELLLANVHRGGHVLILCLFLSVTCSIVQSCVYMHNFTKLKNELKTLILCLIHFLFLFTKLIKTGLVCPFCYDSFEYKRE